MTTHWKERFRTFKMRHPALVQAVLWALPAIVFGLILRAILLAYQPLAYWGADSESYLSFAYRALHEGVLSIPQKRRFLYPILLFPVSLLPGSPLRWLAIFQHMMGLLTLIPFAYAIRKIFWAWRWWIVPLTVIYAGMPIILWYEHELLGEALFFASVIWIFAAWVAWVGRIKCGDSGKVVWWIFFAMLAICVLTKPSARFFWPGLAIGLAYVHAWRFLNWRQWAALAILIGITLTVGEGNQASRLLYSSTFPLTVLDSPKHSDLKADIAPLVRSSRARLDYYYLEDDNPKRLLNGGYRSGNYPAWQSLHDKKGADGVFHAMRDLAIEGILAHPIEFIYIGLQRMVGAINWTVFKIKRFGPDYLTQKFEEDYANFLKDEDMKYLKMVAFVYGIPASLKSPPFTEVQRRAEPFGSGNNAYSDWMTRYVSWVTDKGVFVAEPERDGFKRKLWEMTPTFLGWWLIVGGLLSFLLPGMRATMGVWLLIVIGYLVGVHLVGSSNPRFFAAAWPPLLLAFAVPLDVFWRWACRIFSTRTEQAKRPIHLD